MSYFLFLLSLILFLFLYLLMVPFLVLYERHNLGLSQLRVGPLKSSVLGMMQTLFDALKLFHKTVNLPMSSYMIFCWMSPSVLLLLLFFELLLLPIYYYPMSLNLSLLLLMCLVGVGPYLFFLSGMMSSSKFGLLGSLRSGVQSFSYEIIFFYLIFGFMLNNVSSMTLNNFKLIFWPLLLFFFLVSLGETGRAPMDFMEGESELVSGYNIEYSSVLFVFLFLSEYGMILFFMSMISLMIFGSFNLLGFFVLLYFFIMSRSSFPRYRYDMMMSLFWTIMLPLIMQLLIFYMFCM